MKEKTTDKEKNSVPALEKTLDIIEYLMKRNRDLTTKEISKDLNIPIATTYRIVQYLENRGYLKPAPNLQGGYFLGYKFLHIAESVKNRLNLSGIAVPVMKELADSTGHTVNLGVLQDFGVMYILQELPATPVNIIAGLRVILSVNTSAIGKVLIAYLSEAEQDKFLSETILVKKTEKSITDKASFKKELYKIRKQSYATDNEEYAQGISCLAAPIYDFTGNVIASIGITGHTRDYSDDEKFTLLKEKVIKAAKEISSVYGYNTEI